MTALLRMTLRNFENGVSQTQIEFYGNQSTHMQYSLTTVVEPISLHDVQLTQHSGPTHRNTRVPCPQCIQRRMPREKVGVIVHYTVIVITNAMRIDLRWRQLSKICLITWYNVVLENLNVLITVWSALLMPEPNNMSNLVNYCMEIEAWATKWDPLWLPAFSDSSDIRTASERKTNDLSFPYQQDEGKEEWEEENSHTSFSG